MFNWQVPKQVWPILIKYTNRLFLDLLYNLSKYPHAKKSKRLVREGLFDFEENNVFRASKAKK